MIRVTRGCDILLLVSALLLPFETFGASIDLNEFAGAPEVAITPDGSSAAFTESLYSTVVSLTNDPSVGDAFVIVPGPGSFLTFDYTFIEAPGDVDTFSAYLFLALDGPVGGLLDEFTVESTQSGMVTFDLSLYYMSGQEVPELGLQFVLFDEFPLGSGSIDSTASISNLVLSEVPVPAAVWLFGSALVCLVGFGRQEKSG